MRNDLKGINVIELINYLIETIGIDSFNYRAYFPNCGKEEFSIESNSINNLKKVHSELKKKNNKYLLGFESRVVIEGKHMHIPMVDFSNSRVKDLNLQRVREILNELRENKGFVLDSGRCFHYYGENILKDSEWLDFMKRCSFYDEIGEKYINHQLREGTCCLRIVTNKLKPKNPIVVDILG